MVISIRIWPACIFVTLLVVSVVSGSVANEDPFPYKNSDDPVFVVVTGQSNAWQGFTSRDPMERNPLVRDWKMNSNNHWVWRIPDPNGPYMGVTIWHISSQKVVGYPQGGRGGIAWGLADALSKTTGRRVYMLSVAQGSQSILQWEPGIGAVGLELDTQVSAALAQLQVNYPSVLFADAVVWVQGESDAAQSMLPEEYANRWIAWRDHAEGSGNPNSWADTQYTKWYLTQMSQENIHEANWEGHDRVLEIAGYNTTFVSSDGKETVDTVHFWGDQANLFGKEISDDIAPPAPGC